MKKIHTLLLGMSLLATNCLNNLMGQTTLDAEFRPRIEYRQGFRKPLADTLDAGFVTLQRTRFNADYKGKILNARISFQDARVWGNNDTKTNASKLEIYEAWFEYLIASGVSVQMGRQPLKYDDQRLLAAPAWSNTGSSHDIMVFKYNSTFIEAHAGFAYNNTKDTLMNVSYGYTAKQNYKMMNYIWLSKELYTNTKLTLISINEGFENKTNYKIVYPRYTFGGNLVYTSDSSVWGATLTAYKQKGKNPAKTYSKTLADLNALFLAAKFSYKINKKLSANVGIDYYTGSAADIDASKSNTFNRLYGSSHSFTGNMEYFVTLPTQGLKDIYGGINAKLTPKVSIEVTGHAFYFDKDFIYKKEKTEKNLGTEADVVITYSVSKEIVIQGGYSQYFNSSSTAKYYSMQGVKAHPQQWCYVMFTIRPQFYKTPIENK